MSLTPSPVPSASKINHTVPLYADDTHLLLAHHAFSKLQTVIVHSKAMLIKVKNNDASEGGHHLVIPLIPYIVALLGNILEDQNDGFKRKITSLGRLRPLVQKPGKPERFGRPLKAIDLEVDGSDFDESNALSYTRNAPYRTILEQLIELLESVVSDQKKKLLQLVIRRDKTANSNLNLASFKDIINPIESQSIFNYIITNEMLSSYQFQKVPIFLKSMEQALDQVQQYNKMLQAYKAKQTDGTLKKLPHWPITLHRIIITYFRLLDLYSMLRKFGKTLYSPVSADLHNPKLLYTDKKFILILDRCDDLFLKAEKNGPLLSQVAKNGRNGSIIEATHETLAELVKGVATGIELVQEMIQALRDLIKSWESLNPILKRIQKARDAEMAKSPPANLPISSSPRVASPNAQVPTSPFPTRLKKITENEVSKEQPVKIRHIIDNTNTSTIKSGKNKTEPKESLNSGEIKSLPSTTTSPTISRTPSLVNRPRSNSNASVSSTSSSLSSISLASRNPASPMSSKITSPASNSPTVSRSPSLQRQRPQSVIYGAAFDIRSQLRRQERAATAAAKASKSASPPPLNAPITSTIQTRRRSSSLQSHLPNAAAASALATAPSPTNGNNIKHERASSLNSARNTSRRYVGNDSLGVPPGAVGRSRSPSPLRDLRSGLDDIVEKADGPAASLKPESISPLKNKSNLKPSTPIKQQGLQHNHESSLKKPLNKGERKVEPRATSVTTLKSSMKATATFTPESHIRAAINKEALSPQPETPPLINDGSVNGIISSDDVVKSLDPSLKELTIQDPTANAGEFPVDDEIKPVSPSPVMVSSHESPPSLQIDTSAIAKIDDDSHPISPEPLITANGTTELTSSKPIVKKVRFTGVPPESPPSTKRKLWKPLQKPTFQRAARNKTSLTVAAETLKQERLTFHSIRRGSLDFKTGKVNVPASSDALTNNRMMGSLAGVGQGIGPSGHTKHGGKWSLFKDKFS